MILSLQCHKSRVWNPSGKLTARIEWLHLVFALVHDKCWDGDLGQQLGHIQISGGLEVTVGALSTGRLALPLGIPEAFLIRADEVIE
jgi:hypothetical protein